MAAARRSLRVEDPVRMTEFLDAMSSAPWQGSPESALDRTFLALNELIHHEVLFYYAARRRHRRLSTLNRGLAIVLGTAGALAPLLAGADPDRFRHIGAYGYPLLVGAAAMLLVNRLFGATGGHIRYVTAQLQLERLITLFRLNWAEVLAHRGGSSLSTAGIVQAFDLLRTFVLDAHKIIQDETNVWGKSVAEALDEYAQYVSARRPSEHVAPPPATESGVRQNGGH
jgi:hypothetical protein